MSQTFDCAVVGGGIVGLAFAWESARRGQKVAVFERGLQAQGASIRNFGMIWPIGQPPGEMYRIALRSRERWLELKSQSSLWIHPCGSIHAAYEDDENRVLQEFATLAPRHGIHCEYVEARDALHSFPALQPDGLQGVLYSQTELAVDPRQVTATLPAFLAERYGVQLHYGTTVTHVESGMLRSANGEVTRAKQIFVCSGSDFETLFPSHFAKAGIRRCKLQMMRTAPQPDNWRMGPHLAGGLTLLHYKSFELCDTLPELRKRITAMMPDYLRDGIHVMASQNHLGEVIIGDSHEYDHDIEPWDKTDIDDRILNYLWKMLRVPDPRIQSRWHGIYAKHPSRSIVIDEPLPNCHIIVAPGGAGMTLSFGFARDWWDRHGETA